MSDAQETIALAAIEAELEKISSVIAASQRLTEDGRIVDLGALQGRIEAACTAAAEAAPGARASLHAKLEAILTQLDTLETALRTRFGDLPVMPGRRASTAAAAYADALKHFP